MSELLSLVRVAARRLPTALRLASLAALGVFVLLAWPTSSSDARYSTLSPSPAAAICPNDPNGTGWLTLNGSYNASGDPQKLDSSVSGDINSATVYAWIHQLNGVDDGGSSGTKDCGNPVYRYGGLAWLTNSTTATLDWGAWTDNGSSGVCYPLWGTADYMHANSTTTCIWSVGGNPGINYHVLGIDLAPANIQYRRNTNLTNQGDFEFVWDSCSTFYQSGSTGEIVKTGVPKSDLATVVSDTTAISWKPGANCGGGLTQDDVTTGESFWYVTNPPATTFSAPTGTVFAQATSYSVAWSESYTGRGIASRSLQRRVATYSAGACGAYANDGSPSTAASPINSTGLVAGKCYQWIQTLTDDAGNQSATTSGTVIVDPGPTATFTTPPTGTSYTNATSYSVGWTETTGTGTIASRSLQRQVATSCTGSWANDGSPVTTASPVNSTGLSNGHAYQWIETLTNSNGYHSSTTSGCLLVDSIAPTGSIDSPENNRPTAGSVTIQGSATDSFTFRDYTLDYGVGSAPSSWTTIANSTSQISSGGTLGSWDTTALQGVYTLRLSVRDWAGNAFTPITHTVYLENTRRGSQTYFDRIPFDLGGGWNLGVGVSNGEATLNRDLFTIPSYGPAQALSLSYSSLETTGNGHFGTGWVSNLTQYLTFESGFIVWHSADGGRVPFGQVGGVWTPLQGHFESLAVSTQDTVTTKDQTKYVFDRSTGRLLAIANRFGKQLSVVWGTSSATATDASGRATTLAIDSASGRVTGGTDSAGRAWAFGYTNGNLTTLTDPAGKVTTFAYDGSNRLTTISRVRTAADQTQTTIVWSVGYSSGKATSVTDPVNATVSNAFTYSSGNTVVGLLKQYSPVVRNTSIYTFDSLGRATQVVDPDGYTTTRTFDANSNLLTLVTPIGIGPPAVGRTTNFTYDANGNVLTQTADLTATSTVVTAFSYNATNDLLTRSDADNDSTAKLVTKYVYDGSGHLVSVDVNCTTIGTAPPNPASSCTGAGTQDPSTNLVTTDTWTANDQLLDETDPVGIVTHHAYDAWGNETSVTRNYIPGQGSTSDQNVVASKAFDQGTAGGKSGLATSSTDPDGNVITWTFDPLGRPTSQLLPGDATVPALTKTFTYDELGNLLTENDAWIGVLRTTVHAYDNANREISVTDPSGALSTTAFDAAGSSVSAMAEGVTTNRTFDGLGHVLTESVGAASTVHVYDGAGNEVQTVDPTGVTTDRVFDLGARLTTENRRLGRRSGPNHDLPLRHVQSHVVDYRSRWGGHEFDL